MVSVETIFHFPRGGERPWGLVGLGLGVVTSVLPVDLGVVFLAPLPLYVLWLAVKTRSLRTAHLACGASFALVAALAIAAPLKWRDRHVQVSATTLPLPQLAKELRITHGEGVPNVPVTLPSVNPTWGEAIEAIEGQTPQRVAMSYCGSGANLLFGLHPMRRHLEPR